MAKETAIETAKQQSKQQSTDVQKRIRRRRARKKRLREEYEKSLDAFVVDPNEHFSSDNVRWVFCHPLFYLAMHGFKEVADEITEEELRWRPLGRTGSPVDLMITGTAATLLARACRDPEKFSDKVLDYQQKQEGKAADASLKRSGRLGSQNTSNAPGTHLEAQEGDSAEGPTADEEMLERLRQSLGA